MAQFRITWRHEVIIEAKSIDEARSNWQLLNLGNLDQEQTDKEIVSHEFVDDVSFDED